jgi:hypothetical protein
MYFIICKLKIYFVIDDLLYCVKNNKIFMRLLTAKIKKNSRIRINLLFLQADKLILFLQ